MAAHGLYRIRNGWANQHSVVVKYDDGNEIEVPEDRYREQGCQPAFEQLKWKDEDGP
jgi:hypothetical protein